MDRRICVAFVCVVGLIVTLPVVGSTIPSFLLIFAKRRMQFRTQIPTEPTPAGLVLVQTDQGHTTLKVKLPPGGQPGDTIIFEIPDDAKYEEPILSQLETKQPSLLYKICCCCCLCCFPNGLVVSEWTLAFLIGLWIGLSIMLGFALGTLSIKQEFEPEL